jgi:probable F420-dependent oxidoreductase
MRLGVVFPQIETSGDADAIDEYVAAVVEAGYDHLIIYDHVLGADISERPNWPGPYTHEDPFHEPLTLLAYLAARCSLDLMTSILVLPQRQTALVAKQAAEVDVLSRGRLRLGVGIGWNTVEYEALGEDFSTRGRRMDEQIALLRQLWTEPLVTFEGEFHTVRQAGILPLPVQRPIPVWLGAGSNDRALERAGRLADGVVPLRIPGRGVEEMMDAVRAAAVAAGRDPDAIGLQGRVPVGDGDAARITDQAERWVKAGSSHLAVDTMAAGLRFPDGHVEALRRAAAVLSP